MTAGMIFRTQSLEFVPSTLSHATGWGENLTLRFSGATSYGALSKALSQSTDIENSLLTTLPPQNQQPTSTMPEKLQKKQKSSSSKDSSKKHSSKDGGSSHKGKSSSSHGSSSHGSSSHGGSSGGSNRMSDKDYLDRANQNFAKY
ncbi:hypothetical protein JX265_003998 [Neoarthrinium moseri]|uniref:Uncharacterized protein n=1 Tax=Neoarthrinium moseri TaxID=1658444 RepID=A0A9Q0AT72_9PEZI|nr:uncharacterized protein JN550_006751 [Neoarthrinium moseri]KAI1867944.1 hypothetical protein JN550_006751 [Neoarthrinium moseri]KAI1876472.1 hypothetical protein JX265_003998 [Neoarthrinium moseri]